jgi:hypothetical protein
LADGVRAGLEKDEIRTSCLGFGGGNAWKQYGDYPQVQLPDKRTELALGDLVSGEECYVVLMLEVLPLPLLPDGTLPASLGGQELVALEFAYMTLPGQLVSLT